MTTLFPLFALIAVLAATALFARYAGLRLLYDYQLSEDGIVLVLLRALKIWKIPYAEITDIRKVTWNKGIARQNISWFALKLGNRLQGDFVLLRRNRGLLKEIHLTPRDVDQFVSTVASRVPK
jgi:hypothetical protein